MKAALAACTALMLGACQAPRVITSMTATDTQMKMVYSQAGGARTGLIQCDRAEDGSLNNCKRVPIAFQPNRRQP